MGRRSGELVRPIVEGCGGRVFFYEVPTSTVMRAAYETPAHVVNRDVLDRPSFWEKLGRYKAAATSPPTR